MAAGNTELCEIIDVEPKSQCKACLTHWSAGIVYCTCGRVMGDGIAENKKYISSVLDLFSIPNFFIRKGRPHGHRYGKAPGCKTEIPHSKKTSQEVSQEEIWQHSRSIHPRHVLEKNDGWVGSLSRDHPWDGSTCKRRAQPYCHTRRNQCLPWQLVDALECGEFRYDADKASTWLQENIVDIVPPKESGGQEARWKLVAQFLLTVAMANKLVGTRLWEFTTKMEWPLIERKPVYSVGNYSFAVWISATINAKFIVNISVTAARKGTCNCQWLFSSV